MNFHERAGRDFPERAKKAVAMTRDPDIAAAIGPRHVLDQSDPAIQVWLARIGINRNDQPERRNFQHADRCAQI
jgi:hypothetical protein